MKMDHSSASEISVDVKQHQHEEGVRATVAQRQQEEREHFGSGHHGLRALMFRRRAHPIPPVAAGGFEPMAAMLPAGIATGRCPNPIVFDAATAKRFSALGLGASFIQ